MSLTMAVACIRSSSLPYSFFVLELLNGPTIWWGDFLLTYNALLHILHSSKKEFLSTINSIEKGLFKKSDRRRFPQERNTKSRRARQTSSGRPMLPIFWSRIGDGTTWSRSRMISVGASWRGVCSRQCRPEISADGAIMKPLAMQHRMMCTLEEGIRFKPEGEKCRGKHLLIGKQSILNSPYQFRRKVSQCLRPVCLISAEDIQIGNDFSKSGTNVPCALGGDIWIANEGVKSTLDS